MNKSKSTIALLTTLGLAFTLPFSQPSAVEATEKNSSAEIIVKFKDDTSSMSKKSLHKSETANILSQNNTLDFDVVEVEGESVAEAIKDYEKMAQVEYAEPIITYSADWTPDDPYYRSGQYGPQNMQLPAAWEITRGNSGVIVAVIDSGVEANHPDLQGQVIQGYDYIDNDPDASDVHGHGTHVAGTVAASTNNRIGVAGVAPNVKIMPVRVLNDEGYGTNEQVANGILYAVNNGADVINMSLGDPEPSQLIEDAVNYAWSKGVVIVASAGNKSTNKPNYPGTYDRSIAVAALDENDRIANFSNYGDWVDVAAPGVDILSTTIGGGYGEKSGTSMAAPHVAGVAALLASQGMSHTEIRAALESTADHIPNTGNLWIHGKVNALKALGGDAYEPNDSRQEAKQVSSGKSYSSLISSNVDTDWFTFKSDRGGNISASLTSLPADYDLYLYNSRGSLIAKSENGRTTSEELSYSASGAGTYYVKVSGYNGAMDAFDTYSLKLSYTGEDDGEEDPKRTELDKSYDSPHPYSNNYNKSDTYTKAGASKVGLHFTKIDTEATYDFVYIKNADGEIKHTFDGKKEDFWVYVDGDTITANLVTDFSVSGYGYSIDKVAYYE
ncbi:S8 family serine peptidase [Mechercharimyces sp. CAU 1602]|uniref:S8 family serine peptidase n=1 Tax=Mechercharimyces sp. CAU 1602 TaxID=2973933 RepID=UPI00216148DC|nr:S8 family serine peptidase [Mechercharimyces sp. CAU 1602]MCS1352536.1 S8 family serine peptidase [Mechercharimyces sp. CAU 1602]